MTGHAQSGIRWATSSSYQLVRNGHARGRKEGEWVIDCSRDKLPKRGSGNGGDGMRGCQKRIFRFTTCSFQKKVDRNKRAMSGLENLDPAAGCGPIVDL